MITALLFTPQDLLNLLETGWVETGAAPAVYPGPGAHQFALLESEVKGNPALAGRLPFYPYNRVSFAEQTAPVPFTALVDSLQLQGTPSVEEFSREVLVLLKGCRQDFEDNLHFLYDVEYGSDQPFQMEAALLEQFPAEAAARPDAFFSLLRLRSLHAFAPIARWLKNPQLYEVFLPYRPEADSQPGAPPERPLEKLYIQWGYSLPFFSLLEAKLPENQLRLLRSPAPALVVTPTPRFYALLQFGALAPGPGFVPVQAHPKGFPSSPVFTVPLELRPQIGRAASFHQAEKNLLKRLASLQHQLERLRIENMPSEYANAPRLFIYRDRLGSPGDLRQSIVDLLLCNQADVYQYACLRAKIGEKEELLHCIAPVRDVLPEDSPPVFNMPDYEFYLDPRLQPRLLDALGGWRLYLPVVNDSFLEFYPPLHFASPGDARLLAAPLLGQNPPPETGRLLILNIAGELARLFLPDSQWTSLRQAIPFLNLGMLTVQRASVTQNAPQMIEAALDQALTTSHLILDDTGKHIQAEIDAAWEQCKFEMERLLEGRKTLLRDAREVNRLAKEVQDIHQVVQDVRADERDAWVTFVNRVALAQKRLMESLPEKQGRTIQELETLLTGLQQKDTAVRQVQNRLEALEQQVLKDGSQDLITRYPAELRRLADLMEQWISRQPRKGLRK